MQNPIPKLRQKSTISKKPVFLSEKLKTLTSSYYHRVSYFLLKLAHVSYLPMSTKGCSGTFLFCLDLESLIKMQRRVCRNHVFLIFANKSRSKQNLKNPTHPFVDIGK